MKPFGAIKCSTHPLKEMKTYKKRFLFTRKMIFVIAFSIFLATVFQLYPKHYQGYLLILVSGMYAFSQLFLIRLIKNNL